MFKKIKKRKTKKQKDKIIIRKASKLADAVMNTPYDKYYYVPLDNKGNRI